MTAPTTSNISNTQPTNTDELDRILDWANKGVKTAELKEKLAAYIEREKAALLNELLDTELPWPKDVFGEVDTEDWPKINDFAEGELGYPIDRISATLMRRGWKCFERVVKQELAALTGGSDE